MDGSYVPVPLIPQVTSPEIIEPWEGLVTFLGFPVLVVLAYLLDIGYFSKVWPVTRHHSRRYGRHSRRHSCRHSPISADVTAAVTAAVTADVTAAVEPTLQPTLR